MQDGDHQGPQLDTTKMSLVGLDIVANSLNRLNFDS